MTGFAPAWIAYLCAMYGHAYSWTGGNTHPLAEVPVGAVCSRCGHVYQPRAEGGARQVGERRWTIYVCPHCQKMSDGLCSGSVWAHDYECAYEAMKPEPIEVVPAADLDRYRELVGKLAQPHPLHAAQRSEVLANLAAEARQLLGDNEEE